LCMAGWRGKARDLRCVVLLCTIDDRSTLNSRVIACSGLSVTKPASAANSAAADADDDDDGKCQRRQFRSPHFVDRRCRRAHRLSCRLVAVSPTVVVCGHAAYSARMWEFGDYIRPRSVILLAHVHSPARLRLLTSPSRPASIRTIAVYTLSRSWSDAKIKIHART